jgi:hypothetical protein
MTYREKSITLARKIARHKYKNKCLFCGREYPDVKIDGSHLYPEEYQWLASEPDNIIALCSSHHKFGRDSWHKNPITMYQWIIKEHADIIDTVANMYLTFDHKVKPTPKWWEQRYIKLKEIWKILEKT